MNYYITHSRQNLYNAGKKAPDDINEICNSLGWKEICIPKAKTNNVWLKKITGIVLQIMTWMRLAAMRRRECVLYQYPMYSGTKVARPFLNILRRRGVKTIVLIHDIESIRSGGEGRIAASDEITFFDLFSNVICHNSRMKEYLVRQGIDSKKIICLQMFDYLVEENGNQGNIRQHDNHEGDVQLNSVIVAGNLDPNKCAYIYEFAKENNDIPLLLYGGHYSDLSLPNVHYCGIFEPDQLPFILDGDYGLVWDGYSIQSCEGTMGAYLRYNNPHKLSLYLSAGIPVIVWDQSAVCDFVRKHECGIIVSDLTDMKKTLGKITTSDYRRMRESSKRIGKYLREGQYLKHALKKCGAL